MPDGTRTAFGASHWGAFTARATGGRLVGVEPFDKDPSPAPFIQALPDAVHAECRVATPAVRKSWLEGGPGTDTAARGAEPFVAVSWERALDLVAGELERIGKEHGNEAIYGSSGWGSAGTFHHARSQLGRFLNLHGGFVDQVTSFSVGAATVIVPRIVGSMQPVFGPVNTWPTIVEHTDLMVAFGGMPPKNSMVNQGGVGAHEAADWHRRAVESGTRFVCIGPIRDDTGDEAAAEWHPVRPNTDLAVMLGLAHTLLSEDLHDADFLARYCTGFDRLAAYLLGEDDGIAKDADWASGIAGMPAGAIRGLARRMASSRTLIGVSWSVQRADRGEQPYWMTIALAAMLGQIGLPGGGFGFGYGAMHGIGAATRQVAPPRLPTGTNGVECNIPVARLADMLLNPGAPYSFNGEDRRYPDIRLIYWCGGNPFHKHQDLNNLLRGWAKPDTIVIHEPWWTPAAKRADIVLPCTTTLERNDIAASQFDRFVFANQRAIDPVGGARNEYDIYSGLADRLGFAEAFTEGRNEMEWLRHLYDLYRQRVAKDGIEMPGFESFWEAGHFELPQPDSPPIPFADFREDPDRAALKTPSGRIEIYSKTIAEFGYEDVVGPPDLDGTRGMARQRQGGALPAPHAFEPAARAAPQPARLRFGEPRRQGRRPRGDADEPGRRRSEGHCGRRCRARLQRPRRLPRRRHRQRRDPPGRGRACNRRLVRSRRSGNAGKPGEARQPERAHHRQADLDAHPVLRGPDRTGGGGTVQGGAARDHRIHAAAHRRAVRVPPVRTRLHSYGSPNAHERLTRSRC